MPNEIPFYLMAVLTLSGAVAAMSLRNLVHCALCAAAAFAGLAGLYLQLNAEFVGFAQFLVYVGAIAILIVFTVLLTHGADVQLGVARLSPFWLTGLATATLLLVCLAAPIFYSPSLHTALVSDSAAPANKVGMALMGDYVLPLETTGLLLTVAFLGAVVIAMNNKSPERRRSPVVPPSREVREEVSVR